ncbi:MAG: penicillin-binding transpeptidase domain-containing protein [Oscillibacter sp.]
MNCSKRAPGHGQQNLTQAFANSCNPAFINIGLRIGNDKFYQYMLDFGLTEKTGIDTTGEASGFVNSEIKYSTLALACYAFGQNFNVTPIALLAARCACVNGSYAIRPILPKRSPTRTATSSPSTTPRPSVRSSPRRRPRLCATLWVRGHKRPGQERSGRGLPHRRQDLAQPIRSAAASSSFVCFAPADDPQVMMLLTLDEPSKWTGTYVSGGNMVARGEFRHGQKVFTVSRH